MLRKHPSDEKLMEAAFKFRTKFQSYSVLRSTFFLTHLSIRWRHLIADGILLTME